MALSILLLFAVGWAVASAVLSENIEIEKNYMTPIQACNYIDVANISTNANATELLDLEGHISVIFKITPILLYQHQVAMFQRLYNRFVKNGFQYLNFVLITSAENYDKNVLRLFTKDIQSYITNITVIEEEEADENMPYLRANQVVVIDQCQKLTYLVVPPWSFIEYPYVKAAVLSTAYDNPCECYDGFPSIPLYSYGVDDYSSFYQGWNTTTNDTSTTSDNNNNNGDDRFSKMTTNSDYLAKNDIESTDDNITTIVDETSTTPDFNATNVSKSFLSDIEQMAREDMEFLNTNDEQNLQVLDEYPDSNQQQYGDIEDISNYVMKSYYNETTDLSQSDDNFTIPLMKITLPTVHMHQSELENGTKEFTKYEYIILQMGNPNFHDHHIDDGEQLREVRLEKDSTRPAPSNDLPSSNWEILKSKTDKVFVNDKGDVYRAIKEFKVEDQVFEELQNENIDITQNIETKDEGDERQDDLKRHYEKLVPWLSYQFKT